MKQMNRFTRPIILIVLLLCLFSVFVYADRIQYSYDASGNRTHSRTMTLRGGGTEESQDTARNTLREKLGGHQISVYPNPTEGQFSVEIARIESVESAFVGGVAAGVSEGTSLAFAELSTGSPFGVLLGHSIIFGKSVNFTTTSVNSVLHPVNAAQIFLGRYYTDENGNVWDQTNQGLSRFLWEGPQTWAGYNWSQIRSIGDRVDEVDYLGGATFCINEDGTYGSVSLGNYINADIDGSYNGKITDYPVLMHEYGHTFDSREAGPTYLFTIGIPSAISASNSEKTEVNGISTTTYKLFWTEQRASLNAYYYFNKYYGVKITDFKYYLPYHQP